MTMEEMNKLNILLKHQVNLVEDVLSRYVNDEVGGSQKDKYEAMSDLDKISLLTNALNTCPCWDDFETELVINFDYNNY